MDALRLGKSVRQVTVLERDTTNGGVTPVVVFKNNKKKKRKSTRALAPIEKAIRRFVDAQGETAANYVERHDESNRKRRDGWIRDINLNLTRASRKGAKRLKLDRWLEF